MNQLNILIIDDNQDLAEGLAVILEEENYQVTLAYNGTDGIKAFNAGQFDVVFLDIKMPDINGIEVFRKIHKEDSDTRIIMMTGYRLEQLLVEFIDDIDVEIIRKPFELDGCLLKPFDPEQMLHVLEKIKG